VRWRFSSPALRRQRRTKTATTRRPNKRIARGFSFHPLASERGFILVMVAIAVVLAIVGIFPRHSNSVTRVPLVIFYADETVPESASTKSYQNLVSALTGSDNPVAAVILREIRHDVDQFRDSTKKNIDALMLGARRHQVDLAVFTNTMAIRGYWQLYRAEKDQMEDLRLPVVPVLESDALEFSPLSRPEFLQLALSEVGSNYSQGSLDVILITDSHGSRQMALMPRISSDLAGVDAIEIRQAIDAVTQGSVVNPRWTTPVGTDKIKYWNIIGASALKYGMGFSLVFRQACQSGVETLTEMSAIPPQVIRIADTRDLSIDYDAVSYRDLESVNSGVIADDFAMVLEKQSISVQPRLMLWFGFCKAIFRYVVPFALLLPMILWMIMLYRRKLRLVK
jgi:hypothetical protein